MRTFCCVALMLLALPATAAPPKAPPRTKTAPPLSLAAWKPDHDQLRALLAAGEDPNAPNMIGLTPWMWSLIAQDRPGFELLFDGIKDFRPKDSMTAIMFLFEIGAGEGQVARALLDRGVPADARTSDGTTALMVAAANAQVEMVGLLLARGADVNAADQQGDTALMSAVRAGSLEAVKKLLAARAAVGQRDHGGKTAMTYAVSSGRQDVQRALREAGAAVEVRALALAPATPRAAVERSLPLLTRASNEWLESGACLACHLQPVMMRVAGVARKEGFATDGALFDSLERSLRKELGPDFARFAGETVKSEQGVAVASMYVGGDQAFNLAFTLTSAFYAGMRWRPYDRSTARLLARMQQPDGSFRHGPDRVPMQSGDIPSTALAARVLQLGGREFAPQLDRARRWLVSSVPRNLDDAAFRVLGLRWLGADATLVASAVATLAGRQLGNGGWAQVDGLNPDAYATGLALVALAEGAAMTGADPVYRRGVSYLLGTQEADGSWLVHKRSVPVNKYFESGFPHGKFQFSSFVGTAWATMALMYAEPMKRS